MFYQKIQLPIIKPNKILSIVALSTSLLLAVLIIIVKFINQWVIFVILAIILLILFLIVAIIILLTQIYKFQSAQKNIITKLLQDYQAYQDQNNKVFSQTKHNIDQYYSIDDVPDLQRQYDKITHKYNNLSNQLNGFLISQNQINQINQHVQDWQTAQNLPINNIYPTDIYDKTFQYLKNNWMNQQYLYNNQSSRLTYDKMRQILINTSYNYPIRLIPHNNTLYLPQSTITLHQDYYYSNAVGIMPLNFKHMINNAHQTNITKTNEHISDNYINLNIQNLSNKLGWIIAIGADNLNHNIISWDKNNKNITLLVCNKQDNQPMSIQQIYIYSYNSLSQQWQQYIYEPDGKNIWILKNQTNYNITDPVSVNDHEIIPINNQEYKIILKEYEYYIKFQL